MTAELLAFIDPELAALREAGLFIQIRTVESAQGPLLRVNGREVLNFCSNNYLGLANHPRLVEAAIAAIRRYGIGPASVRTISGTMSLHVELEERLARFKGSEAVLALQSGFVANQAVIPALVGEGDLVISDALNHASIIDGVRLTRAGRAIYAHADVDGLEARLMEAQGKGYRRILVITDGVFSMDGDIAPLSGIVAACERHGALLMVDDAHGEGVLGRGGRGIADHFGLHGRVDIEVGTLSKAFGVVGGMVAGKAKLIDYLRQKARPFLFSSATTVPDTAACLAAVELLEESGALVEKLWRNTRAFKAELQRLGFDTGRSETPITPVMLGEAALAQEFSRKLFAQGVFAMPITFPTVPRGQARLRVMISAAHEPEHLDRGLEAFQKVGKELGVIGG
jgi:glycine C-acetyltransferase